MLAIELLIDEILRLQNLVLYLQAQLQEARKMRRDSDFWDIGSIGAPEMDACAAPLVVLMEDEITHTDEHPYCGDETCPCMGELYDEVERREQETNSLELEQYGTHAPDCRCAWCEPEV